MSVAAPVYVRERGEPAPVRWWVLLISGIAWILASVLVLDADFDSALTIGYLVAGYLIAAGATEFVVVGLVPGWKWLHTVLGVLLVLGGVAALTEPFRTYAILASLLGFFLVVKGTAVCVLALAGMRENTLWWLLLVAGVAQVVLGFWAAGYPGRSAWLLVLWVGLGALFRGVSQLVAAFQIHGMHDGEVR